MFTQYTMLSCKKKNGVDGTHTNGTDDSPLLLKTPKKLAWVSGELSRSGDRIKPLKFNRVDEEVIRLIGQTLDSLGLERTAAMLSQESGCSVEDPAVNLFRNSVLCGHWNKAMKELSALKSHVSDPHHLKQIRFLLYEQKYLELLEEKKHARAVHCLQNELGPLRLNIERLHQLSLYLFALPERLRDFAEWSGRGPLSRQLVMERIQDLLPATVMLPPHRLQTLIKQAMELQTQRCRYHNSTEVSSSSDITLLSDHRCLATDFPSHCNQTLTEHSDEVLHCRFSPSGEWFATASRDEQVIIWAVDERQHSISRYQVLVQPHNPTVVSYLSWSPDSRYLIALGPEDTEYAHIWNIQTGKCERISNGAEDSLTCGCWLPDSTQFVLAGTKGHCYLCSINGPRDCRIIRKFEGIRVHDCIWHNPSERLIVADGQNRVRSIQFEDKSDRLLFTESSRIVTFALDSSSRYLLCSLNNAGCHLWDLQDRVLVRKLHGLTQDLHKVYACFSAFGGAKQDFVASGSEDGNVYVWNRGHGEVLERLKGHGRPVNCVDWHPHLPSMLASASDDCTVKIWTPPVLVRGDAGDTCSSSSTNSGRGTPSGHGTPV